MRITSIKFLATALISLLGIITISFFVHFSFKNTKASLERKYADEAGMVLMHTLQAFQSQFESAETMLDHLSITDEIQNATDNGKHTDVISLLTAVEGIVPDSGALYMGLKDGRTLAGAKREVLPQYDPRKRGWYILAEKAQGKLIWTEPYLDYVTQRITITAAKSILSETGECKGVIALDFDVSENSRRISSSKIGRKGFAMLLSSNGTVIANRDDSMVGEKLFKKDFFLQMEERRAGDTEYMIKEEPFYLKYSRIRNNGMLLITGVSKKEIDENVKHALFPILVTGVVCLLGFGTTTYFLALRGIAPVRKLARLMLKAQNGNYMVQADIQAYDEIRSLSESFNSMIEGIRRRDEELTAANRELASTEEKLWQQYIEMEKSQKVLKDSEEKIKRLAYFDSLTGLSNRQSLIAELTSSISAAERSGTERAVIYIDLDNFKTINDTLGHSVGDKVLIEIARRLNGLVKCDKVVARIGGDEFIILVNEVAYMNTITDLAQQTVNVLERPVYVDTRSFNLTASIGVAMFPEHGTTAEELLKKADMAMYRAKANGKNCFEIFNDSMQLELVNKVNIENGLRKALKNNEFTIYYQPQYDLVKGRVHGIEALLRWISSPMGYVPPSEFIKVAEETGLIVPMEKWVFRQVCRFARELNENNGEIRKVSVNISVVHIMQSDFVKNVREIVEEEGINPAWIELEITETVMMECFASNKKKLEEIKKLGIDIHLDDFGSGYSSLNYLQNLPIDYVKVDKAFIDNMLNSEKDGKITATILELAHNIGLKVVAEGVEKKEQYDFLTNYRCDIIQGYYISKPVPKEEVRELICLKKGKM